jgi:hypothetical protein
MKKSHKIKINCAKTINCTEFIDRINNFESKERFEERIKNANKVDSNLNSFSNKN